MVELLVVIAIIAMLLAILMPALGKVRQLAYRMMCGTNLKGLGNAMMVYSNDYDESYPRSGGRGTSVRTWAEGLSGELTWAKKESTPINWNNVSNVTITSAWFLLIKYSDVSAKQFVCQASNQKQFEFDTSNPDVGTGANAIKDITEAWDFGKWDSYTHATNNPYKYVSYCMQNPFFSYSCGPSASAGKALAADRSPWIDDNGQFIAAKTATAGDSSSPQLLAGNPAANENVWDKSTPENRKGATSQAHQAEGQNVLFNDVHVSFEKEVTCGAEQDNIYTTWQSSNITTAKEKQIGVAPGTGIRNIQLNTTSTTDTKLSKTDSDTFLIL